MNKRTYAIIPISKTGIHIKANFQRGRLSNDRKFIIWDQAWDARALDKMKKIPGIKLLNHDQALKEVRKIAWFDKEAMDGLELESENENIVS